MEIRLKHLELLAVMARTTAKREIAIVDNGSRGGGLVDSEACPYCLQVLNPKPHKKAKCVYCGNEVFVRAKHGVLKETLFTYEETFAINALTDLKLHSPFLYTDIERIKPIISKGRSRIPVNELTAAAFFGFADRSSPYWGSIMLRRLAWFQHEIGIEHMYALRESKRAEILYYEQTSTTKHLCISTMHEQACSACDSNKNKLFTFDEARRIMPIPRSLPE